MNTKHLTKLSNMEIKSIFLFSVLAYFKANFALMRPKISKPINSTKNLANQTLARKSHLTVVDHTTMKSNKNNPNHLILIIMEKLSHMV